MKQKRSTGKSPLVRLVGWHAGHDVPATGTTPLENGHRLAPGIASAAAVAAAGLLGPAALASPGDLDPSFADVGRWSGPDLDGPLWSLDVQDNGAILFAGGDDYCYYTCELSDFTGRLLPDGTLDTGFSGASLANTVVYDTAQQSDGKLIGVGTVRRPDGAFKAQVFRLLPNGSLDAGFGLGGLVLVAEGNSVTESGHSVIVQPDGRIVFAGARGSNLLVVRLLPNGAPDPAFGTGGIYVGPVRSDKAQLVPAPGGGYRVMASLPGHECSVSALTEAGTVDAGFGNAGVALLTVAAPQRPAECISLATDSSGRLLVGGRSLGTDNGSNGYVGRLLANGAQDPGLSVAPIFAQFREVTALTIGPTGSIFVAGLDRTGFSGATVVRMFADGSLDPLYGRAGSSRVELKAPRSVHPVIHDMQALGNDALVVGGSRSAYSYPNDWTRAPFAARLLGNAAGSGPGLLSIQQDRVLGTEQAGKATVSVRRIGGSRGAIAVSYAARDLAGQAPATKGLDYTAIAGRLTWADGDDSAREIVVPIASDTLAETPEFFELVLDTPEGGAGLGVYAAEVEIAGEGYPAGLLSLRTDANEVPENDYATFYVSRAPYSVGTVTVTVRVAGGSATPGRDFSNARSGETWNDVTVTLADGQTGASIPVWTTGDHKNEQPETLTLEIVSPTGGAAVIGALAKATVTIVDAGGNSSGRSGGGGTFGWFAALLLGFGGGLRRLLANGRGHRPSA